MTFADLHQQTEASVSGKPSLVVAGKFIRVTHTGLKHIDFTIWTERQHLDKYKLYMGKFVSIATGCKFFLSGNHRLDRITTYLNPYIKTDKEGIVSNGDIHIGNDVWIGQGVTIMSGVKIGNGAVIAADSTITKDVDPYTIVGGIPGKPIKKRFDDKTIERLLNSNWWDLPDEWLRENSNLLFSDNIEEFLNLVENAA